MLVAAGCGGGRLSHGDYVKKADDICAAYRAQVPALASPRSYDAIVRWGEQALPLYAGALQELRRLRPPAGDEQLARAWLRADLRVQEAVRDLVAAARKRDFATVSAAASRAQLAGSASRQAAQQLGLEVCGTIAPSTGP